MGKTLMLLRAESPAVSPWSTSCTCGVVWWVYHVGVAGLITDAPARSGGEAVQNDAIVLLWMLGASGQPSLRNGTLMECDE